MRLATPLALCLLAACAGQRDDASAVSATTPLPAGASGGATSSKGQGGVAGGAGSLARGGAEPSGGSHDGGSPTSAAGTFDAGEGGSVAGAASGGGNGGVSSGNSGVGPGGSTGASGGDAATAGTFGAAAGGAGSMDGGAGFGGAAGQGVATSPWPGWRPAKLVGAECALYEPDDLSDVDPLAVTPCESGAPGCSIVTPAWVPESDFLTTPYVFSLSNGHLVLFVPQEKSTDSYLMGFFDLTDGGAPLAAWRADRACLFVRASWNDQALLESWAYSGLATNVFWGTPQELRQASTPQLIVGQGQPIGPVTSFSEPSLGEGVLSTDFVIVDEASLTPTEVAVPGPGDWMPLRLVGTDLMFYRNDEPSAFWVRKHTGEELELVTSPGSALRAADSDGARFVWTRAYGDDPNSPTTYSHCELWTSAYPNGVDPTTPVRLAGLPACVANYGGGVLRVHGANASYQSGESLAVYDLDDGSYRLAPYPYSSMSEDTGYLNLLWGDSQTLIASAEKGYAPTFVVIDMSMQSVHPPDP